MNKRDKIKFRKLFKATMKLQNSIRNVKNGGTKDERLAFWSKYIEGLDSIRAFCKKYPELPKPPPSILSKEQEVHVRKVIFLERMSDTSSLKAICHTLRNTNFEAMKDNDRKR